VRKAAIYTIREGLKKRKNLFIKVFLPAFIIALGAVGLYTITSAPGAVAAPVCVNDTAGANDQPGQKDLTKLCVDYAGVPTTVQTTWNWDETGTNGANTMDACSLFDTDGDGNINYSVCVTTKNDPAQLQTTSTYSCGDSKSDRCTSAVVPVSNGTTSCNVSQVTNDPFPSGTSSPKDTQGTCTVDLSTVGGASAKLIDVCSYPSGQPNSDPSDCVIAQPKSAKLEVRKQLVPASDPGLFNLQIDNATKAANVGDGGTTGEVIVTADNNNSTHAVGETAGTNTLLGSYLTTIECRDQNGTGNIVASGSSTSINVIVTDAADIVCVITNTRNTATITTSLKDASNAIITEGSSVPLGTVMHDLATVTLTPSAVPTGSVTFRFYTSAAACTADINFSGGTTKGTIALDGNNPGVASPSTDTGTLGAGAYAFKANWPGNANYPGTTSSCENFTVSKADTTTTTQVHNTNHEDITNTSVALGTVVHDSTTVGTQVGNVTITGNLTYHFYTDGDCDGTPTDETVAVSTESTVKSSLGAGSYSYKAEYGGDSNYNSSIGICEPFTISQAQLGINTTVHSDSPDQALVGNLPLGGGAHDSASVTGKVGSFTLPDVTFYFFDKGVTCTNGSTTGGTPLNTLSPDGSGIAHPSTSQTNLAAGTYNFVAVVASNDNYQGATGSCEPFTVDKSQLTMESKVHNSSHVDKTNSSVPLGSVMHDTAKITGGVVANFTPPAITFTFYGNGTCDGEGSSVTNSGADEGDATRDRSVASLALAAGSYSYKAFVAGNANYIGSDSGCEPFTVDKAQLAVTTAVHNASHEDKTNGNVPLGSVMHDTATVTGGVEGFPVPTLSFTLTTGYDDTCDEGNIVANNGTEGDAAKSADSAALGAGAYAYRGSVAGNDNYLGGNSDCEPFNVNQATPTVVTEIHDGSEAVVTSGDVGAIVHDKAIVSGINGFDPTGNVDFTFYNNDSCEGEGAASGTGVALASGVAHPSDSQGPLNAGSYSFQAHYDGDENYLAEDADCEPLAVNKVSPDISTTPNPANGNVGVTLNDSAILTGGLGLSGSVTFNLYSPADPTCADTPTFTNTVTVNGAGTYDTSTGFVSNASGTWRWVAVYSGDGNNNSVADDCNDEQVTIDPPPVVLGESTDKEQPPPVVLGETTPQVLALTNTGSGLTESLAAAILAVSTLLVLGYSRFARKLN